MNYFAHVLGTGSAVPSRILSNFDLEKIVDTSDEWITRRTGIKERRVANIDKDESTAALGTRAAAAALTMAGITPDEIDQIIVATVTADMLFPSAGCLIQKELGAQNAAAYDISAGCSGFLYGLELANNSIRCGSAETILMIGAERLSSVVNWQDRGTCVLLGDGAGAVVLRRAEAKGGILSTHIKSDGRFWDLLYSVKGNSHVPEVLCGTDAKPFFMRMEGNRLFKQAVGAMANIAEKALESNGLTHNDISLVIPHQANLRIIQAVADRLQIPMEKVFTNLDRFGNTSSASIPLAMDEAVRSGRLSKSDYVLLISFGAGLTWGGTVLQWTI